MQRGRVPETTNFLDHPVVPQRNLRAQELSAERVVQKEQRFGHNVLFATEGYEEGSGDLHSHQLPGTGRLHEGFPHFR